MNPPDIFIYGTIGWDLATQSVIDQLEENKDATQLNIRIASPGGDIYDSLTIMNAISRHKAEKKIFIDGLAASMASVILCGVGGYVVAAENSRIMIHNPWVEFAGGEAEQLRKDADQLDELRKIMIATYKKRIGQSDEEIIAMMDAETWFTADEAKKIGLVDEVTEPSKMAAKLDRTKLSQILKEFKGGPPPQKKENNIMPTLFERMRKKHAGICPKALAAIIAEAQAAVYDTQEACESAGGKWDANTKKCTDVPGAKAADITNQGDCESAGGKWDANTKKCTDVPDAKGELDLEPITSQQECEAAGKYWYNDACNDVPEENIMAAEDAPQDEQSCKDAGGTWDPETETCTMPPDEADNTSSSRQPRTRKTTVVTETFAMKKQKQEIAALKATIGNMNKSFGIINKQLADSSFRQIFGDVNMDDEILNDIKKVTHFTKFVKDGILDTDRYEAALTQKRDTYKRNFSVQGMQGMTRPKTHRDVQAKAAAYAEGILARNNKGGKK